MGRWRHDLERLDAMPALIHAIRPPPHHAPSATVVDKRRGPKNRDELVLRGVELLTPITRTSRGHHPAEPVRVTDQVHAGAGFEQHHKDGTRSYVRYDSTVPVSDDECRPRPYYVVKGIVVDPAQLVKLGPGRYAEPQLARCVNGHNLLAPGSVTVGWLSCPIPGVRGGHRVTRCLFCGVQDYRPPLDTPVCDCELRAQNRTPRMQS